MKAFPTSAGSSLTRREFLKTSSLAAVAGTLPVQDAAAQEATSRAGTLRVGLIGCGGRGTGAAAQALAADSNVKLVALGDAFNDRLQGSLATLKKQHEVAGKIEVPEDRCFVGFDAYQKVIEHSDVVLLATPPHFRPRHLEAAIAAGKHVFAEKPVAVDAPGVRKVLAVCEEARKKNLSIVSGLAMRYSNGHREIIKRIHDGAIGEIRALQANDYRGPIWVKPRQPDWTDMHWQMRNWYYFTWLSGDFNVEQHVHSLDKLAWAMKDETPVSVSGTGGRQQRTDPKYGNIYDHFNVVYEYANGVKGFASCRHFLKSDNNVSDHIFGSKGTCHISSDKTSIEGAKKWRYDGPDSDMYQNEHNELFASIRAGKPINNGHYMSMSSMLAIAGRMSAYTGKTLTWDECFNSRQDLTPPKYDWSAIEVPQVAIPGFTPFV